MFPSVGQKFGEVYSAHGLVGRFPQFHRGPIFRVTFELKINSATKLLDDWMEVLRVTDQDADLI